jgi:hypothetical protein
MQRSNPLGSPFWKLWTATGVSSLGDGMVLVAFPLLALTFTRNPIELAGVVVAGRLPALLVALPAGVIADRVNRRRMLLGLEWARFAALAVFAGLVLAGKDSLPVLYATVFVIGGLTICFDVTSSACLPSIVSSDQLVAANAHLLTADITAEEMVGQAVGGAAFAAARSVPFAADAASFIASAVLLRRAVADNPPAARAEGMWDDLRAGVRWVVHAPMVRLLFGLIGSFAFCQAMVLGVLVLYGRVDLHLSTAGYGLLLSVAAIGNIIGAMSATRVHARLGGGWSVVAAGLLAATAYPVLALTSSAISAAAALAVETIGVVLGNIAARSLRQLVVPAELQARVGSAYQMCVLGSLPLGSLAGGLLADWGGVRWTMAVAGIIQVTVLAVISPKLIHLVRDQINGPIGETNRKDSSDPKLPADTSESHAYTADAHDRQGAGRPSHSRGGADLGRSGSVAGVRRSREASQRPGPSIY